MWILNYDTRKWTIKSDTLDTTDFESLKQDLKSLRFYQKVLSGSTFVTLNNLDDAYDILSTKKSRNYNYTSFFSPYVQPYLYSLEDEVPINATSSQHDLLDKFLPEYGLTLKNLFTPTRLIESQFKNLLYVDVATNQRYENLTQKRPNFIIDDITLKEGHRVLVKDQIVEITLPSSTNPDTYFDGFYRVIDEVGTNVTYQVWTSENGIYIYKDQALVRTNDLDVYENLIKYSICVKLGTVNRETQWCLNRLTSGYFPEYQKNESVYFTTKKNYVLRNRMDYNNLFELVFYDTIKHGTQSVTIDNVEYTIPERTITVGEFGTIICHQNGFTNIVNSKYKTNLRSIEDTSRYYWICGDDGHLLRVDKVYLKVEKIKLEETLLPPKIGIPKDPRVYQNGGTVLTTLNSVSFYNDLRGVVVGKFNQLWITDNGGSNWKRINLVDFDAFNYNVALYQSLDRFYVGGDNGVFLDFFYDSGNWTAFKRRVSKFIDEDDEYLLVDDITDFEYFSATSDKFSGTQSFIAISCTNNNLYLYDIGSNVNKSGNFVHLGANLTFSDIKSITYRSPNLYFSTFERIYRTNPLSATFSSNVGTNILQSTFFNFYTQSGVNKVFNYNDSELIYTGIESLWKTSNYSSSPAVSDVYDNSFFGKLKPRLLFMNYDQGSKLNWFDDFGQYRLPESYLIPVSYLIDSTAVTDTSINFRQNSNEIYDSGSQSYQETNWITYWKDRLMTFEYYTHLDDGFKVEPSFQFDSSDYLSGVFTYSSTNITIQYSQIQPLMPSRTSRYREGLTAISSPVVIRNLYFYGFLGIWAVTIPSTEAAPKKGDVIYIESDVITGKFIINKIFSVSAGGSTVHYQYFFTNFNENIINNLNEVSYLTVTNLNKYPTTTGGVKTFTTTFVGTGYNQGSYKNTVSESLNGYNATFDIQVNGAGNVTSIKVNKPGYKYSVGDQITILSSGQIGGSTNIVLTITSLDYNSLFVDNFKKHYISYGYNIEVVEENYPVPVGSPVGVTQSFQITGKYSQYSAYYNLQCNVQVVNTSGFLLENEIRYKKPFLNFGYTPTYNLLSYLNFIDPNIFTPNKEFVILPKYDDIPGSDSGIPDTNVVNDNLIYVDFVSNPYSGELEANKLYFGVNLKPIWDSFLLWTFVDLIIKEGVGYPPTGAILHNTNRLLIVDKYYDTTTYTEPYYVLVFNDKFSGNNTISAISIYSRRTLRQISEDLQYMNNIQRPYSDSDGNIWSETEIESGFSFTSYESPIKFKIPTDSYTKALVADTEITKNLSGIVYTDYEGNLSIQMIKLDQEYELPVNAIFESALGKYQVSLGQKHFLQTGDSVIIRTATASVPNHTEYIGFQTVNVLDIYSFELNTDFNGVFPLDNLVAVIVRKDPFLNFEPIDIFDLGVGDKKVKQSIEITREMWDLELGKYKISNIDFKKFRFRLIDGLDLVKLTAKFFWVLDAEVSDAIIGMDENENLIWYQGIWEGGRWFGGTWISGTWKSGDWYEGIWTSKLITDKLLSVKVDNTRTDEFNSTWYGGRWFDGTWENGTWYGGRWYAGTWDRGRWFDGTWNDGNWNNGVFSGGIWVLGNWANGLFNTNSSLSYWLDGKFNGGDFENGIWYNGEFNEQGGKKSRFGTKSFNSRNSIWYGGKFIKGEFHSFLNINDKGLPDVSEIHKYSKWYSGLFSGGVFYGGDVYNINFNSSLWQGGISNEISIIRINTDDNKFTLSGIYRFNIGDIFFIVDNLVTGVYSVFGTTAEPRKYLVLDTTIDEENNRTEVFVDVLMQDIMSVDTGIISNSGIKCVSSFKGSTWNSGIWFNGVFDEGYYNGGIWYNGWFNGIWG